MKHVKKINNTILLSKRKIKGGVNPLVVAKGFTTLHLLDQALARVTNK
jgi:hypothetical protein